jgi:hypothetical protein
MGPMDPLIAIGTLIVVLVASRLTRSVPVVRWIFAVLVGLAAAAASNSIMDWATADQARLSLLLDVMIGVALFAVYERCCST